MPPSLSSTVIGVDVLHLVLVLHECAPRVIELLVVSRRVGSSYSQLKYPRYCSNAWRFALYAARRRSRLQALTKMARSSCVPGK